jgi:DNA topoisomerase-1
VLERIAELAIPPAWKDVWICMDPVGHLQATGIDAAGRKQYRYHDRWRSHRDRLKFDSMIAFGEALPRLRRRVARDLGVAAADDGAHLAFDRLTHDRVLACAIKLLDIGFFRIGSEDYAQRNESYGLTTMLREHVTIDDGSLIFDFPAKSGQRRVQEIAEPDVQAVIVALKRRRSGSQLLAYRTSGGWAEVHADEVNDAIKRHAGGDFTAKDFRTWNATVLAAVSLAVQDGHSARGNRERRVRQSVKTVAAYLGNTPAVCRASYIDPRVIDRYNNGVTIGAALAGTPVEGPNLADAALRKRIESAVLELLADAG